MFGVCVNTKEDSPGWSWYSTMRLASKNRATCHEELKFARESNLVMRRLSLSFQHWGSPEQGTQLHRALHVQQQARHTELPFRGLQVRLSCLIKSTSFRKTRLRADCSPPHEHKVAKAVLGSLPLNRWLAKGGVALFSSMLLRKDSQTK